MRKLLGVTVLLSSVSMQAWAACLPAAECSKISDLEDFSFGTYTFVGDFDSFTDICPHTQNDDENDYMLTLTGAGTASAFVVRTGGGSEIPLTVYYRDDGGLWETVTAGVPTSYSGANQVSENCTSGLLETGSVRIEIPENTLQYSTAGSYSGVITFSMTHD